MDISSKFDAKSIESEIKAYVKSIDIERRFFFENAKDKKATLMKGG